MAVHRERHRLRDIRSNALYANIIRGSVLVKSPAIGIFKPFMVANSVEAAIAVAFISLFLLQLLIRLVFWSIACSAYDNDSDDASDAGAAAGRIKMMR